MAKEWTLSSFHKKAYGVWRGRPMGNSAKADKCCTEVHDGYVSRQCSRPRGYGPEEAYCKQHDPAAVKAKHEARNAKWQAQYDASKRRAEVAKENERRGAIYPLLIATLQSIANGHNDPASLAREVLESERAGRA